MYEVFLNDTLIYSSDIQLKELSLVSGVLSLSAGKAGSFTFSITPDNLAYEGVKKLKSYIDVYKDSFLLFSGRVINVTVDFNLTMTVTCEGLLAILNDSILRPVQFNDKLQKLLETIVASHNSQVDVKKKIKLGIIDIEDDYLYRNYENYESTMSRMSDLVDAYGGYLSINKITTNGVSELFLNWLGEDSITSTNQQSINFGENLLDVTQEENINDIVTVLIPLGGQIEDDNGDRKRLTIEDVNDHKDYLVHAEGVERYGYIYGVQTWDDVYVSSILKSKGQKYLNLVNKNRVIIKVSAVDLSSTSNQYDNFNVGQKVTVISSYHHINRSFIIRNQQIDIINPANNSMTLDESVSGYISASNQISKINTKRIDNIISNYVVNETVQNIIERVTTAESKIEQTPDNISIEVTRLEERIDGVNESLTNVQQTANDWSVFVENNNEVLTYLKVDEDGLWIGKGSDEDEQPIKLLQQNDSIKFLNTKEDNTLLEINTLGMHAPMVYVDDQLVYDSEGTPKWITRKGALVLNGGKYRHNLNDLWVGE